MSIFVNDIVAREAHEKGIKIGETEPCRETKGTWWEVVKYREDIIACVMSDGVVCGEKISKEELHLYVDDLDSALAKLS